MGIGSEGYVALQHGRKFIGIELKESYFNTAARNLQSLRSGFEQASLLEGDWNE
jgi:DNA modification methylase